LPIKLANLAGQFQQIIRGIPHGADDDHHLIPALLGGDDFASSPMNPLGIRDAAATEFLND
jgi:hypothetical protein